MSKVAELEKLDVSQMEVLEHAKLMADMYGGGDRMWQTLLASEARQNTIVNDLLSSKVVVRLGLIARGDAPDLDAVEASSEDEASAEPVPASEADEAEPAPVSEEVEVEPAADSSPAPVSAAAEVDETADESPETVTNKV
jgi:hypothetical protein